MDSILVLVQFLHFFCCSSLEWLNGTVDYNAESLASTKGFIELGKFCVGYMNFSLNENETNSNHEATGVLLIQTILIQPSSTLSNNDFALVLFDSEKLSYYAYLNNTVYHNTSNCIESLEYAHYVSQLERDFSDGTESHDIVFIDDKEYPRYWYIFIVNCYYKSSQITTNVPINDDNDDDADDGYDDMDGNENDGIIEYVIAFDQNPNATTMFDGDDFCREENNNNGGKEGDENLFNQIWFIIIFVVGIVLICVCIIGLIICRIRKIRHGGEKYRSYNYKNVKSQDQVDNDGL